MPLFNSQIHWRGIGATVAVVLLTSLALAFAVVSYVEWSSNAAVAEFMSAAEASASDPNHSNSFRLQFSPSRAKRAAPRVRDRYQRNLCPCRNLHLQTNSVSCAYGRSPFRLCLLQGVERDMAK